MWLGFAQVAGWPAPVRCLERSVQPATLTEEDARSEHTYGGLPGRRCCTFLLYSLFDPFEFRF
jgi:hypothetical protein